MWKESDKKLVVHLESSSTLFSLLLLMHLGAWGSLLIVPLPWYVKALLAIAVGFSLRRSLMTHALRREPDGVVVIELQENDCAVRLAGMTQWTACCLAGYFVHSRVVVLRLQLEGRRSPVNVVVLRGCVDEAEFRHLRVRLIHN